ncbi:uncharacterized protein BN666_00527 [Bacteroides sp. CAG:462]|mgnify:FL=1|uniref:hypothetical protein n=1 Tax=Phocaeicola sp. TaxID=2773926 RepID=UPI0003385E46|nr:uncharacterized protein BN666_00527 [Bacteroides sp. CAG:462]
MTKVVHVHLIFEKKDYYFGSLAAIYSVLGPEEVGVSYNTLRHIRWSETSVHTTNRAIIKIGTLIRSTTIRTNEGESPCNHG